MRLIFADAPYNIGKDFGNNSDKWDIVSDYIEWCKEWIDECMRVLMSDGTMYFMTAIQHMPYLDIYVAEKYNVLSVAIRLNRVAIGIELNEEYYEIGLRRTGITTERNGKFLGKAKIRKTNAKSKYVRGKSI